ncbi:MAG: hypothetical protein CBC00_03590 [Verrucomicrobia bacterium TMED40]|jgi:hypothetical protein|nr:MAG: hypothetical protein CBC00_03590 [Verrucomicrobia bacterium TMED40]|tara:strand:- start:2782 stop:3201 length:420 start_codon:yes stop_codon:yes gene_type:complete
MNRSVEILNILRTGMNSMIAGDDSVSARYTRIFNFNENRISLKMDVLVQDKGFVPMGRIDITEIPTNNGRITCSCVLSELQTGNSQRVILRLKDPKQRQIECEKVYEFFRRVIGVSESQVDESQETAPVADAELGEFTD